MSDQIKFTHKGIATITPRASRYVVWFEDRPGFGLRVTPRGRKTFVLAYRFDGKPRLHTIETSPESDCGKHSSPTLKQSL